MTRSQAVAHQSGVAICLPRTLEYSRSNQANCKKKSTMQEDGDFFKWERGLFLLGGGGEGGG